MKNQIYAILLRSPVANRLYLTIGENLDEAWKNANAHIVSQKDIPASYSLALYTKATKEQLQKMGMVNNVSSVVQEIQEKEKVRNKKDFINTANLLKDKYATSQEDKKVIEKVIKNIK